MGRHLTNVPLFTAPLVFIGTPLSDCQSSPPDAQSTVLDAADKAVVTNIASPNSLRASLSGPCQCCVGRSDLIPVPAKTSECVWRFVDRAYPALALQLNFLKLNRDSVCLLLV